LLSLVTAFWLVESPLWLISVGENERAKKNIKFIARFNGVKDLQVTNLLPNEDQNEEESAAVSTYQPADDDEIIEDKNAVYSNATSNKENQPKKKVTFCSSRSIFINLVIMAVMWTASSFNYYLMTFFLKYIPGNIFVNTSISSCSEIVAYVVSGNMVKFMGIKISYITAWIIGATGGILMVCFSNDDNLMAVFVLLSKFGVSFAFNNSYLGTPKLFPVALCGTAFGICNVFARFATVLSPLVAELPFPGPMMVFSILCIISGVLVLFLQTGKIAEEAKK